MPPASAGRLGPDRAIDAFEEEGDRVCGKASSDDLTVPASGGSGMDPNEGASFPNRGAHDSPHGNDSHDVSDGGMDLGHHVASGGVASERNSEVGTFRSSASEASAANYLAGAARRRTLAAWIGRMTGEQPTAVSDHLFRRNLRNGVLLCRLMAAVHPEGGCNPVHDAFGASNDAACARRNVEAFLEAARLYGLSVPLFGFADLDDRHYADKPYVVECLLHLKAIWEERNGGAGVAGGDGVGGPYGQGPVSPQGRTRRSSLTSWADAQAAGAGVTVDVPRPSEQGSMAQGSPVRPGGSAPMDGTPSVAGARAALAEMVAGIRRSTHMDLRGSRVAGGSGWEDPGASVSLPDPETRSNASALPPQPQRSPGWNLARRAVSVRGSMTHPRMPDAGEGEAVGPVMESVIRSLTLEYERQLVAKDDSLKRSESELAALRTASTAARTEIEALRKEFEEVRVQLRERDAELRTVSKEHRQEMREVLEDYRRRAEAMEQRAHAELEALRARVEAAEAEAAGLRAAAGGARAAEGRAAAAEAEAARLRDESERWRAEMEALRAALTAADAERGRLGQEAEHLRRTATDAERRCQAAEAEAESLRGATVEAQARGERERERAGEEARALARGQVALATLTSALASPRARLAELREEVDGLKAEALGGFQELRREAQGIRWALGELRGVGDKLRRARRENAELWNQVQDLKGQVRVFCRVRPSGVTGDASTPCVECSEEDREVQLCVPGTRGGKGFTFDRVFGPRATQEDVFREMLPLVRSVVDGYNVCVFAYGQTGSGKTFTMTGPEGAGPTDASRGVNWRALDELFRLRAEREEEGWAVDIEVQVLEIYNDNVRDLLFVAGAEGGTGLVHVGSSRKDLAQAGREEDSEAEGGEGRRGGGERGMLGRSRTARDLRASATASPQLQRSPSDAGRRGAGRPPSAWSEAPRAARSLNVMSTQRSGLNVPDATRVAVQSAAEAWSVMARAEAARAFGETQMNERSSRSHCVACVVVRASEPGEARRTVSCLNLVDLAGSERLERSGAEGDRLRETGHINKSLSALGDVMAALQSRARHVPYRNSKLTRLLQDSLQGQAKTMMFMHVAPEGSSYGESLSTLLFGQKVASVTLGQAQRNVERTEATDRAQARARESEAAEALSRMRGELEEERRRARRAAEERDEVLGRLAEAERRLSERDAGASAALLSMQGPQGALLRASRESGPVLSHALPNVDLEAEEEGHDDHGTSVNRRNRGARALGAEGAKVLSSDGPGTPGGPASAGLRAVEAAVTPMDAYGEEGWGESAPRPAWEPALREPSLPGTPDRSPAVEPALDQDTPQSPQPLLESPLPIRAATRPHPVSLRASAEAALDPTRGPSASASSSSRPSRAQSPFATLLASRSVSYARRPTSSATAPATPVHARHHGGGPSNPSTPPPTPYDDSYAHRGWARPDTSSSRRSSSGGQAPRGPPSASPSVASSRAATPVGAALGPYARSATGVRAVRCSASPSPSLPGANGVADRDGVAAMPRHVSSGALTGVRASTGTAVWANDYASRALARPPLTPETSAADALVPRRTGTTPSLASGKSGRATRHAASEAIQRHVERMQSKRRPAMAFWAPVAGAADKGPGAGASGSGRVSSASGSLSGARSMTRSFTGAADPGRQKREWN